jgi:hypothetical protein
MANGDERVAVLGLAVVGLLGFLGLLAFLAFRGRETLAPS